MAFGYCEDMTDLSIAFLASSHGCGIRHLPITSETLLQCMRATKPSALVWFGQFLCYYPRPS